MEKKLPIKKAEAAKLLAKFIVENWHHCPVSDEIHVDDCECWGCDNCERCIQRHADNLG